MSVSVILDDNKLPVLRVQDASLNIGVPLSVNSALKLSRELFDAACASHTHPSDVLPAQTIVADDRRISGYIKRFS